MIVIVARMYPEYSFLLVESFQQKNGRKGKFFQEAEALPAKYRASLQPLKVSSTVNNFHSFGSLGAFSLLFLSLYHFA